MSVHLVDSILEKKNFTGSIRNFLIPFIIVGFLFYGQAKEPVSSDQNQGIEHKSASGQQEALPRYMTKKEKALYRNYQPPVTPTEFTEPPSEPVRTMAEWEELQGIMITWTSQYTILRQIVDYAQEECLVYIVCSDSNSVKNYLTAYNIPLYNLKFMEAPYNSIWIRDYGPWTAYSENTDTLNIIDWIYNRPRPYDDQIPAVFANYINAPYYAATSPPYDLIHSGGNFFVDGHGTGFSSKLILQENPGKTEAEIDTIMKKYLGIKQYIKMETLPYDVVHHIDMHMKLLDEETLLVGEYPPGVSDGPQIEANLQYLLNNFQSCYGRPFKVVRIPMPPDQYGHYPNQGGDYRTYTNSVIINKTVIIPTYQYQYDTTAFRIYREAMPGYKIVGINSNSIIPMLGAIHCIVKEVGARNPIWISHPPLENQPDTTQGYDIIAAIKTNSGVAAAEVYWTTDTTAGFTALPMTPLPGDTFLTTIPAQPGGSTVFYYLSAQSNLGKTITKPLTAPAGNYRFNIEITSPIAGNPGNIARNFQLYQNYPNPFNPTTHIGFQISDFGYVELQVYDITGRKIATLVSKKLTPGKHTVQWNGKNDADQRVSSGVYFYQLRTEWGVKVRKIILMR